MMKEKAIIIVAYQKIIKKNIKKSKMINKIKIIL